VNPFGADFGFDSKQKGIGKHAERWEAGSLIPELRPIKGDNNYALAA
jgi:hypothetical protein